MILYKRIGQIFLAISLIFTQGIVAQQRNSENTREILIAGKTGFSYMVTEVLRDFSGTATEFNNRPGLFSGLEISRFFTPALEAGVGISLSVLKGEVETPAFSAMEIDHFLKNINNEAIAYNNRLYGPELFGRYYFGRNNLRPKKINIFLKAGAGILFNESELFYSNRQGDEIIFGKGNGKYKTTRVGNGMFILGGGLGYNLSGQVNLKLAASVNMVGYDFLDVVHNYDAKGNRREVIGMFTDLSAGIAFRLAGREKTASEKRGKLFQNPHLPFSPGQ